MVDAIVDAMEDAMVESMGDAVVDTMVDAMLDIMVDSPKFVHFWGAQVPKFFGCASGCPI